MHPAFSIILFTTASGLGLGLLFLVGVLAASPLLPQDGVFGFIAMALSLGFLTLGLLSSTAHLGHPERAWRALSQWRTSWLSREGVAAAVTFVPAGLLALGWVFLGRTDGIFALAGLLAAVMAVITVYCTAMIYASLKPIHQWRNRWVTPNYLALALMTGALWLSALLHLWGAPSQGLALLAAGSVAVAFGLKEAYWRFIDTTNAPSTPESATGLGAQGGVRLLERPHTEQNYLLREMGFVIGRRHATRLRAICRASAFVLPFLLALAVLFLDGWTAALAASLAALLAAFGVTIERWLFFAQAKHTVTLYYGAEKV